MRLYNLKTGAVRDTHTHTHTHTHRRGTRFVKYCLIGCTGAGLDFLFFTFLVKIFAINYLAANAVSVTLGITNNFFWNAFLNFKVTDNLIKRFLSFYMVGILGLAISSGLLYILVDKSNINVIFAKIFTIFVVTIIQFLLNKIFTFKKSLPEGGIN